MCCIASCVCATVNDVSGCVSAGTTTVPCSWGKSIQAVHTYHIICGACTMLPCASLAWLCMALQCFSNNITLLSQDCCELDHCGSQQHAMSLTIIDLRWTWCCYMPCCLVALHVCASQCITLQYTKVSILYKYCLHSDRPVPTSWMTHC